MLAVHALPHRGAKEKRGARGAQLVREFRKAFGEPHAGAGARGHQLGHHALGDVGGGQKRDGAIVRGERQNRWGHVDIDNQRGVRHQTHLGLAGGAGGHVEHRERAVVVAGADAVEGGGVGGQRLPAFFDQPGERKSAFGLAGEQDPLEAWGVPESFPKADSRPRMALAFSTMATRASQMRRAWACSAKGKTGVERGGDGSGGHHAQIGEVKFGAGFRLQRDDIAFFHPDGMEAHGGPPHDVAHFSPGVGPVFTAADGLPVRAGFSPWMAAVSSSSV